MANRLSLMTAAAGATVATIDLSSSEAVERPAPETLTTTPRAIHVGGGCAQSHAHGTHRLPRGTLVLRLTSADRATMHTWIADYLTSAHLLRHIPDTGAPTVHTSWKLDGTQIVERWDWLPGSDVHRISLPVVDVSAVL